MSTAPWTASTSAGTWVYGLHETLVVGVRIDGSDWIKWTGISASNLVRSSPIRRMRRLAPAGSGADSRSRWCIAAERGGLLEFEFSRAMMVGFWWGLLLRDHNDEGNMFMLTLIGGEWQRSSATVRRPGWCLSTVRAASGEASARRTCAKAFSSSLLASQPTNCSDRWWKTWIWWLPRVWRVLLLRPKIRTICGAIYRVFRYDPSQEGLQHFPSLHQTLSREDSKEVGKGINAVWNDRLNGFGSG
jgi:hypothetical protein